MLTFNIFIHSSCLTRFLKKQLSPLFQESRINPFSVYSILPPIRTIDYFSSRNYCNTINFTVTLKYDN
ncbi:hypothetical protein FH729_16750 [Bacteroides thetaiotaomicron]|nr:hypothetical protein [Bacteroides thetaiotaomicron]MBL3934680.1 hypothetical protein [Bacteroides thetaiotaomicron]MBL3943995.1 hypothetical protein [Bacteroides thetaiotaomicron]MBL3948787.1 hypothetical protein [Bacteroides thetaiotaomicron]MBL3959359.1 hypothetical protein [Bacteroides thetaiotaomicron]